MSQTIIKPTVGRVVLYVPSPVDAAISRIPNADGNVVHAATVAHVNEDGTLNLVVNDSDGNSYSVRKVPLIQDGEVAPESNGYACWMTYQIEQAKKAEVATPEPEATAGPVVTDETPVTTDTAEPVQA